jgi:RNA polymerase sigma-70 factor (ECF subfamily)
MMEAPNGSLTPASLLWRVRNPADQKAWEEFVDRYAPRIFVWCRARGLQDADCEEIAQNVLVKLVVNMQRFEYDPSRGSYRGWLKTVTNHAITDAVQSGQRRTTGRQAPVAVLFNVEARKSLEEQLAEDFDLELQAEAMRRVKSRVQAATWMVFERRTLERQSASEVAAGLDMTVAAVNMANHRVKLLLRAAIQELESGDQPSP